MPAIYTDPSSARVIRRRMEELLRESARVDEDIYRCFVTPSIQTYTQENVQEYQTATYIRATAQNQVDSNPVPPPEESAYQELDRVTSARAHGRVRLNPVYQSRWTIQAGQPEPASPKRKKISNLSVLAEAERKLKR